MAFASYQQSIQLDAEDAFVYLKLAFFYENFASMDWADAGDHAERCYRYYLANVDPRDSGVLTRLGNLLVREHKNKEAAEIFEKVLEEDASLHNVWFNKAHAQLKYGDTEVSVLYYTHSRSRGHDVMYSHLTTACETPHFVSILFQSA
jgi:tetratricopeptide (TPR) repeat protein